MFVYPRNNQSNDQQLTDEYACYTQVQQQTGINPDAARPSGPSAAQIQAAQQQAAANAPQAQGGRARGAAKGAAGGAMVGAITGNAGRGAAVGATVGTVRGGRKQSQANEQSQQQAAQSAGAQLQQQANQAKAAYNKQMDTFKRGFSACMDTQDIRSNRCNAESDDGRPIPAPKCSMPSGGRRPENPQVTNNNRDRKAVSVSRQRPITCDRTHISNARSKSWQQRNQIF